MLHRFISGPIRLAASATIRHGNHLVPGILRVGARIWLARGADQARAIFVRQGDAAHDTKHTFFLSICCNLVALDTTPVQATFLICWLDRHIM